MKVKSDHFATTRIYDVFWEFACERQKIFFARLSGKESPWTNDPILQNYKFTNAYRASDRVSQYLIRRVIYTQEKYSPEDILFRILIFKVFNRIETWELLEKELGEISYKSFDKQKYARILSQAQQKHPIFSSAYIMPPGKSREDRLKKYEYYLNLIHYMFQDGLSAKIAKSQSLEELYLLLHSYDGIGNFLAFQFAIDINYSELCDYSEMSFVVPGPGAQRGIQKCFNADHLSYTEILKYVTENQETEFEKRGLHFKSLFGRRLQLIDCQNLFCEVDKYTRVGYPEIKIKDQRLRIKQKFKPNVDSIDYFFPPKWNLNTVIP